MNELRVDREHEHTCKKVLFFPNSFFDIEIFLLGVRVLRGDYWRLQSIRN